MNNNSANVSGSTTTATSYGSVPANATAQSGLPHPGYRGPAALPSWLQVLASVSLFFMITVGIFGNILILIVNKYIMKRRKTWPTILLRWLAWTDVLNCSIGLAIPLVGYYVDVYSIPALCDLNGIVLFGLSVASQLIVALMSAERCLSLLKPFAYETHFGPDSKNMYYILGSIGLYSLIVALLPTFGLNQNVPHYPYTFCMFDFTDTTPAGRFVVYLNFINLSGCLVIIVVANVLIAVYAWRFRQVFPTPEEDSEGTDSDGRRASRRRQVSHDRRLQTKLAKLTLAVATCFTMCWLLFAVRILTNQLQVWLDDNMDFLAARLMSFNSVLNPLLYIAICRPYRRGCWVILLTMFHYLTCTGTRKPDTTLPQSVG
ncbi:prostaglandin E2 receptor EP3 subtype-like [Branchiostoma lanceolatum]|uniref:prostaglandin E2 receptor EP3 subtype-like n=1 Tax=Branchiostoma lanceolatum TaxID=7740 RepID=UPI003457381C